ncbi:hypothetical protein C6P12_04015 [Weissella confusa]|uniref:DUF2513 domain-containing protein n=1 Tax=Weissella confusa TaxID=1583 RepID=UPI00107F5FED|nr:DUF2513 domain-containing protein [Weissella confusa]TGE65214.1 hypothetical protein C6P12_04015 [Weissella confusa]
MKLDIDYLRDVMIAIEEAPYPVTAQFSLAGLIEHSPKLKSHSIDETYFVVIQLKEAGFVHADVDPQIHGTMLGQLTIQGNEFLNNVRHDSIWSKVKSSVAQVGGTASISVLSSLAQAAMTKYFGLG